MHNLCQPGVVQSATLQASVRPDKAARLDNVESDTKAGGQA